MVSPHIQLVKRCIFQEWGWVEDEEEKAYFQGCYLPSEGRAVGTILVTAHPGIRPPSGRLWWRTRYPDKADADTSGGSAWGFQSSPPGNLVEGKEH